jgi:hypothetical protein
LIALFIFTVLIGVYGFAESYLWSLQNKKLLIAPLDAAWLVFSYAGIVGFVAVMFYGAPVYALLRHRLRASWSAIVMVGAVPGIALLPFDSMGGWFIVGGVAVSCGTHFLYVRFLSNESVF